MDINNECLRIKGFILHIIIIYLFNECLIYYLMF